MAKDYKDAGGKPAKKREKVSVPNHMVGYAVSFLMGIVATFVVFGMQSQAHAGEVAVSEEACDPEVVTQYEMPECPTPKAEQMCDPYDIYSRHLDISPDKAAVAELDAEDKRRADAAKAAQAAKELQPGEAYQIQVASFRNQQDAHRLRTKLAGLGIYEARVQSVVGGDEREWHRVHIGPYEDLEHLEKVRESLRAAGHANHLLRRAVIAPAE